MYIYFEQLARELKKKFNVELFNIHNQIVTGIELLSRGFGESSAPLGESTVYICEYRNLKRFPTHVRMPPLICVIEPGMEIDVHVFSERTAAAISGSSIAEVLLSLANQIYELGTMSSGLLEITRSFLNCGTTQDLLNEGYRRLGNPVIVTDNNQRVYCHSEPETAMNPTYCEILSMKHLPLGQGKNSSAPLNLNVSNLMGTYLLQTELGEVSSVVCKLVTAGGSVEGYLHVLELCRDITEHDSYAIELLGDLLAVKLLRNPISRAFSVEEQRERFFRDILDGAPWSTSFVEQRQVEIGLSFKDHLYSIVIQPKNTDLFARVPLYEISKGIAALLPNCFGLLYRNTIFLLLGSSGEIGDMEESLSPIVSTLEKHKLIAGVSNCFSSVIEMGRRGFQALKALQLGTVIDKGRTIYYYRDYSIYYMMERCLNGEELEMFLPPEIIRLLAHNRNGQGLLETLSVYLKCGRNKTQTARELFIHINTVKYRMRKIQEILGFEVDNDEIALNLILSLKMLEYREAFPKIDPLPL